MGSGDSLACGEFVRGTTKGGASGMVFEGGTCICAEGRIDGNEVGVQMKQHMHHFVKDLRIVQHDLSQTRP